MEADRVILLNAMSERTLASYHKDSDSEIRTFYVGVTRAKEQLDIITGPGELPHISKCLQATRQARVQGVKA